MCLCLNVPFVETAVNKADLDSVNNSTGLVTRWTGPSVSCRAVQSCLGGLPTQASAHESTCSAPRVSVFCSYFKSSVASLGDSLKGFCRYFKCSAEAKCSNVHKLVYEILHCFVGFDQ